jgi:hypothetical protein
MINKLKDIEKNLLPELLGKPEIWNTLDVDYFPPRVERLWTQFDTNHRLFIHVIHPTNEPCLFHKHRWPAAFKMLQGSYEMGIAYSEKEISSDEAYNLPEISKFILTAGSYYEMVNTHTLHYVKPLDKPSISLMITGPLYTEAQFRKEVLNKELMFLSESRKLEILGEVSWLYKYPNERI